VRHAAGAFLPTTKCIVTEVPSPLADYHRAGRPLSCELDVQPFSCEFWPLSELVTYNAEYGVAKYAPGYFGFGTNGGGEMFAIASDGRVVCLPFIGMSPSDELTVANSWREFEVMLRGAL
jgi:hypothetical protein